MRILISDLTGYYKKERKYFITDLTYNLPVYNKNINDDDIPICIAIVIFTLMYCIVL